MSNGLTVIKSTYINLLQTGGKNEASLSLIHLSMLI